MKNGHNLASGLAGRTPELEEHARDSMFALGIDEKFS